MYSSPISNFDPDNAALLAQTNDLLILLLKFEMQCTRRNIRVFGANFKVLVLAIANLIPVFAPNRLALDLSNRIEYLVPWSDSYSRHVNELAIDYLAIDYCETVPSVRPVSGALNGAGLRLFSPTGAVTTHVCVIPGALPPPGG